MVAGTGERREALKARILDAAEEAIGTGGLAALAIRPLAEAAGCSLGMVYKLFADADALVLGVNTRTLHAVVEAMERAGGEAPGRAEALRAMAAAYLDYAAAHGPRWDALFTHRMAGGAPVPGWYAAERSRAFTLLARHAPPGLDDRAAEDWAHTVFSAVHGIVLLGLTEKLGDLPAPLLRTRLLAAVDALVS